MRIYSLNRTIGVVAVLEKLVAFRRIFHRIASEEATNTGEAVVCWVDNILAKLGQAVYQITSLRLDGTPTPSSVNSVPSQASTLGDLKGAIALRAALQLPRTFLYSDRRRQIIDLRVDSLPQIISILGSQHASMAAIRLALRIAFSMTVLHCPVGHKNDVFNSDWYGSCRIISIHYLTKL